VIGDRGGQGLGVPAPVVGADEAATTVVPPEDPEEESESAVDWQAAVKSISSVRISAKPPARFRAVV
jgi:hypothetical protein